MQDSLRDIIIETIPVAAGAIDVVPAWRFLLDID